MRDPTTKCASPRGRSRVRIFGAAGGVVLVLAAAALLWRSRPEPINVLLITLDTTRADRLGCYGYARGETPSLDRLAAEGVRFAQAFTPVPLTLPAHATMLTGLLPPEHGLRDNDGRMDAGIPILSEALRTRGYRTAAFLASTVLDARYGLDRGFEVYSEARPPEKDITADDVCSRALAWLADQANAPFFCWVHFYDPHDPYVPPEPYRSRHPPYDGEIAFMDREIGRLLDFLERRNLERRTLVIACGDHGEALGQHDELTHGLFLYGETMRVPLILRLSGGIPKGVSNRMVPLSDIPATVADVLRWREHAFGGRSLLAPDRTDVRCYGETLYSFNLHRWTPLYSLTTRRWKYIEAPEPELYDRIADARETSNVLQANPVIAADLRRELERRRNAMRGPAAHRVSIDRATRERLRSLGYGGSAPVATPSGCSMTDLRDPKTVTAVHRAYDRAVGLMDRNRHREALALVEPAAAASPESPAMNTMLTHLYFKLGTPLKAKPHIEVTAATSPVKRLVLLEAANGFLAKGFPGEAVAYYRRVLALPGPPEQNAEISAVVERLSRKAGPTRPQPGSRDGE